jgi:hypothetical protein
MEPCAEYAIVVLKMGTKGDWRIRVTETTGLLDFKCINWERPETQWLQPINLQNL